jgi:hypothetical protein
MQNDDHDQSDAGQRMPAARADLDTIVSALRDHELAQLVIVGRIVLDEHRRMLTPSERARHARAELAMIAAALPAEELTRFVAQGRLILEERTPDTSGRSRGWEP